MFAAGVSKKNQTLELIAVTDYTSQTRTDGSARSSSLFRQARYGIFIISVHLAGWVKYLQTAERNWKL